MQPYREKYLWNVSQIEKAEGDDVFKIFERKIPRNPTMEKLPEWDESIGKFGIFSKFQAEEPIFSPRNSLADYKFFFAWLDKS